MAQDPITGKELDDRFEYAIIDGPAWARLCDGLKHANAGWLDKIVIKFTIEYIDGAFIKERKIRGRINGIMGTSLDPSINPVVSFIPDEDYPSDRKPWIMVYWPSHNKGHAIDVNTREGVLPQTI